MQALFLVGFVVINVVVFSASESKVENGQTYHPVFWNASDGQRYWGVAINLVKKGSFTISTANDEPVKRAGPLSAIVFAVPIYLVGLEKSAIWIIIIQCGMLFGAGLFGRTLGVPYGANKDILQGVLIFNPNLISLAHHAQSDLLFMFLCTFFLFLVVGLLREPRGWNAGRLIFIGLTAGLLPLARPLGFYYVMLIPIIVLVGVFVTDRKIRPSWKTVVSGLLIIGLVVIMVLVPWGLRNKEVFGEFSLTHSEGIMMEWHYNALQKYQSSGRKAENITPYFKKYGVEESCIADPRCKYGVTRAYIDAIWETRKLDLSKAIAMSWGKIFFAGGASQLSRYLGLNTPDTEGYLWSIEGITHDIRDILNKWVQNSSFWILFSMTLIYTVICRTVGLIGFLVMIRDKTNLRYAFLHIGTISIFLAMYLFSGISRFRAPLEPVLALLFAIGIGALFARRNRVKEITTLEYDCPEAGDRNV